MFCQICCEVKVMNHTLAFQQTGFNGFTFASFCFISCLCPQCKVSKNVCMAGFCDYKKKRKEEEEEEEGGGGVGMPKLVQYGQRLGKGDAPNYNIRWWPLFSRKWFSPGEHFALKWHHHVKFGVAECLFVWQMSPTSRLFVLAHHENYDINQDYLVGDFYFS